MQLFFVPDLKEGLFELPAEEARHAVQVLRKRSGEMLDIVDGKGGWYQAEIVETSKRSCTVNAKCTRREDQRAAYKLTLAVSPTKSNDRFEWFLEKATEIGVDQIIPLQCKRTERPKIRLDRYEKVLVSAMKQSLQAWKPTLLPFTPVKDVLSTITTETSAYIGWCDDSINSPLTDNFHSSADVLVLIGPEGDFTVEEVEAARNAGCLPVILGPNRLRTETAAVVATQAIALLQELNKK
ncbi:MAG: RsmE family RNA methyltransferase [Bacteroidota bacterium]